MTHDIHAFDEELFESARDIMKARFPEMIEGYLEDAQIYIGHIKDGFADKDDKKVAHYAHPLKSSSQSIGMVGLSNVAKELELKAKSGIEENADISHLESLVPQIEAAFLFVQSKLDSVCARGSGA
ncbi:MAG: Hpt domain-containing protein [Pseudomonadota bacterium]